MIDENNVSKIADFGISSIVDMDENIKGAEGTYHFMSPEVLTPDKIK